MRSLKYAEGELDAHDPRASYRQVIFSSEDLSDIYENGTCSEQSLRDSEVIFGRVGVELARLAKNVDGPNRAFVAVRRGPRAGELTTVGSG